MKKYLAILLFATLSIGAFAQNSVQGKVLLKADESLVEAASIRLLNAKDSTLVVGGLTNEKGVYNLTKIKDGNYIVQIRYLGYEIANQRFTMAGRNIILKNIYLSQLENSLQPVVVTGRAAEMQIKGDTTEYNPAAFKLTENATVEDLLKKLPGVLIDTDGNVTVNGQEIKQIRVDGKKFFTGDVQMATQNITADMVDKVQVYDQKSDMAQLTGFEDENTERIINLKLKENRRNGIFGNIGGGAGMDRDEKFRYTLNGTANIMNGTKAMTNVNFSTNNVNAVRSGGGRGGMTGGGGGGETKTYNIGANSNIEITDSLKVGGNVRMNRNHSISISDNEREIYQDTITMLTNSHSESMRENYSGSLTGEVEWIIDTLSTLVVQPTISLNKSFSESESTSAQSQKDNLLNTEQRINNVSQDSRSESNGTNGGLTIIYNKKSTEKRGRNFTVNLRGSVDNSTDKSNRNDSRIDVASGVSTVIDQLNLGESENYTADIRTSFVEPLWDLQNMLEVSASASMNNRNSDRYKYNDNDGDGNYTDIDSTYSNIFNNKYYSEVFELRYRRTIQGQSEGQSANFTLGMSVLPSQTYSTTNFLDGSEPLVRDNNVVNIAPTANFRYMFARQSYFSLNYNGRSTKPSVDQMQPVKSQSLTNETIGNSSLNPSFAHNFQLTFNKSNSAKLRSFMASLRGAVTKDALIRNSIYDDSLKQYSQTVNSPRMPFNVNLTTNYNSQYFKGVLRVNNSLNGTYSEGVSYQDRSRNAIVYMPDGNLRLGKLNVSKTYGINESLTLGVMSDYLEASITGRVQYNNSRNTINNNRVTETYVYTANANVTLNLPYSIDISNDFSYVTRSGYSSYSKDELVWNAVFTKPIFNRKAVLTVQLNDILQQRQNISETINDASRTLSRSNMITSYFIVSLTYNIRNFGGGGLFGGGGFGGGGGRGGMGGRGGFGGGGRGGF